MLNLDLAAVSRGPTRVQGQISPDDPLWEGSGVTLLQPLAVDLTAQSVGEGILVRGQVQSTLEVECRRCVTRVEMEFDEPVSMLFEKFKEGEAEELAGEVYPLPERGTELVLDEPLREELLLQIPVYVVCSEACRGLCPQCGADLNQADCGCVPEPTPGPWDALKTIKFD